MISECSEQDFPPPTCLSALETPSIPSQPVQLSSLVTSWVNSCRAKPQAMSHRGDMVLGKLRGDWIQKRHITHNAFQQLDCQYARVQIPRIRQQQTQRYLHGWKFPFSIEFSYSLVLCMRRISDRNLLPRHTDVISGGTGTGVLPESGWRQRWMEQDSLNKHVQSSHSVFFHPSLLKVSLHCWNLPARTVPPVPPVTKFLMLVVCSCLLLSPQQIYLRALYSHLLLSRHTLERKDTSVT